MTAESPVDLEQKFRQSFQGRLYVRFLAFGNGTLQALYDRSVGFFRRQIILTVKDRPKERVDDPYIADKMTEEAEGIFLWALEGLLRLRSNDYHFTLSSRAIENMTESVKDANNIIEFLSSEGYIRFKADGADAGSIQHIQALVRGQRLYAPVQPKLFRLSCPAYRRLQSGGDQQYPHRRRKALPRLSRRRSPAYDGYFGKRKTLKIICTCVLPYRRLLYTCTHVHFF